MLYSLRNWWTFIAIFLRNWFQSPFETANHKKCFRWQFHQNEEKKTIDLVKVQRVNENENENELNLSQRSE